MPDTWIYVRLTLTHYLRIAPFNTRHYCDHVYSGPGSTRDSTPYEDVDNAERVTYELMSKTQPEFIFGKSEETDFVIEVPSNRTGISKQHFRLYFNTNRAWILHDLSVNGVIVNDRPMRSRKRRMKIDPLHLDDNALEEMALKLNDWNHIKLRDIVFELRVGYDEPVYPLSSSDRILNLLSLNEPSTKRASSADFKTKSVKSENLSDVFYFLDNLDTPTNQCVMRISDGKIHWCILYPKEQQALVRMNYDRFDFLGNAVSDHNIAVPVDLYNSGENFAYIIEPQEGSLLEDLELSLEELSFVFAQALSGIAFLHENGFRCRLSARDVLVERFSTPVTVRLLGPDLLNNQDSGAQTFSDDLKALALMIIDHCRVRTIDWKHTVLAPLLRQCFDRTDSSGIQSTRLLAEMGPESQAWAFSHHDIVSRIFPLAWHSMRLESAAIYHIIQACGAPRQPRIVPSVPIGGIDCLDVRVAERLLKHHGINPRDLETGSSHLCLERNIFCHAQSGMRNISQVLKMFADHPLPDDFPEPTSMCEVRGSGERDGVYVDTEMFTATMKYFETTCNSKWITTLPGGEDMAAFSISDYESNVLVTTNCSHPSILRIRRSPNHEAASSLTFATVHQCSEWFRSAGLAIRAEELLKLQQPFHLDWKQIPAEEEYREDALTLSPPSSIVRFMFSDDNARRKLRDLRRQNIALTRQGPTLSDGGDDSDVSGESDPSTIRLGVSKSRSAKRAQHNSASHLSKQHLESALDSDSRADTEASVVESVKSSSKSQSFKPISIERRQTLRWFSANDVWYLSMDNLRCAIEAIAGDLEGFNPPRDKVLKIRASEVSGRYIPYNLAKEIISGQNLAISLDRYHLRDAFYTSYSKSIHRTFQHSSSRNINFSLLLGMTGEIHDLFERMPPKLIEEVRDDAEWDGSYCDRDHCISIFNAVNGEESMWLLDD